MFSSQQPNLLILGVTFYSLIKFSSVSVEIAIDTGTIFEFEQKNLPEIAPRQIFSSIFNCSTYLINSKSIAETPRILAPNPP